MGAKRVMTRDRSNGANDEDFAQVRRVQLPVSRRSRSNLETKHFAFMVNLSRTHAGAVCVDGR
jgi:hypothetical protein